MTIEVVERLPVVIVGAGPTGITAATLLAQHGVTCLVLDRWPGVYPQPRAVHLDDETYRVMAGLGISDGFTAISRPTLGLRLLDKRFRVLAEFGRDPSQSSNGFPQANMFDQPELEALLRANLKRYPNVRIRADSEVTDITVDTAAVRVTFADRTDGGVHQVCDPVRAGTYMRIGATRYRWEFRLLAGETADDFGTLTALRPLIAPWTQKVSLRDLTLLRVTEYTFRAQIADRWRRGNIFLLGDAAHLTPPFVGQGVGAGVRDAANLAWKIAGVRNGTLAAYVLESYERERKPHVRQMIRLALGVGMAMTGGGHLGDTARRLVLPRLRLIPGLRDKVVDSATPALNSWWPRPTAHWRTGCVRDAPPPRWYVPTGPSPAPTATSPHCAGGQSPSSVSDRCACRFRRSPTTAGRRSPAPAPRAGRRC